VSVPSRDPRVAASNEKDADVGWQRKVLEFVGAASSLSPSRVLKLTLGIVLTAGVVGCASLERLPAVTLAQAPQANVLNISDVRFYTTDVSRMTAIAVAAYQRRSKFQKTTTPQNFLAISGGGDDGAFGAGLLVGWSARGDRPSFGVVTGVSTGALSAPFAFLGSAYDQHLKQVYTDSSADEIFRQRPILAAVTNDAMADSAPLRHMIGYYVTDEVVRRIAEEYNKGRLLFILTTNLDQGRPVIWNMGAIAASGQPRSRELMIDVLLASASVPAMFPPVMIDVTIGGQRYQEMHVDGGAVAQAFLYPPSFSLGRATASLGISATQFRTQRKRTAYVIRNGRLARPEEKIERETLAIAKQAISTMTASSGVNDTYRIYLTTKRDGVDFNLASIGDDFTVPYKGPFDKGYMRALYAYGYDKGRAGYHWQKAPPGYAQ
jgi:predicted acylesterase/phospholipase RssA